MHIIGGILLFIIVIFFIVVGIGVYVLSKVFRLFGLGRYAQKNNKTNSNGENKQNSESTPSETEKKKIFNKDEGEYVDYEEIKK